MTAVIISADAFRFQYCTSMPIMHATYYSVSKYYFSNIALHP